MQSSYEIEVARSVEQVEQIRHFWISGQWHPNADIDFYLTLISSRKDVIRPHVIMLSCDKIPQLLVVGRIEKMPIECKIGYRNIFSPKAMTLNISYGGFIGEIEYSKLEFVIYEILRALSDGEADIAYLSQLRVDSLIYSIAKKTTSFNSLGVHGKPNIHWRMNVPNTMDEYYKNIQYKFRKNLRRSVRIMEKKYPDGISVRCFSQLNDVEDFVCDAEKIAKQSYQRMINVGFSNNQETHRLITLAARKGWLRSYILYINEQPIAFERALQYGRTLFCDNAAYDYAYHDIDPGTNLFLKVIEDLSQSDEVDHIDFGFGDAQYKRNFGDEHHSEESVYIYAPRLNSLFIKWIKSVTDILSFIARYILRRTDHFDKIKKRWRTHLLKRNDDKNIHRS